MVRLVFRPYSQIWRTICTSVTLRASTRVSPGFTLFNRSSPSFGSYRLCSYSSPSSKNQDWLMLQLAPHILHPFRYAFRFLHLNTRIIGRLLGPCFKTGRLKPFWQDHQQIPQAGLQLLVWEYTLHLILAIPPHLVCLSETGTWFSFYSKDSVRYLTPQNLAQFPTLWGLISL